MPLPYEHDDVSDWCRPTDAREEADAYALDEARLVRQFRNSRVVGVLDAKCWL